MTRNDDLKVKKILGWSCSHPFPILLMATRNPAVAPVEVGSLSNYFQDFIYIPGCWPDSYMGGIILLLTKHQQDIPLGLDDSPKPPNTAKDHHVGDGYPDSDGGRSNKCLGNMANISGEFKVQKQELWPSPGIMKQNNCPLIMP